MLYYFSEHVCMCVCAYTLYMHAHKLMCLCIYGHIYIHVHLWGFFNRNIVILYMLFCGCGTLHFVPWSQVNKEEGRLVKRWMPFQLRPSWPQKVVNFWPVIGQDQSSCRGAQLRSGTDSPPCWEKFITYEIDLIMRPPSCPWAAPGRCSFLTQS